MSSIAKRVSGSLVVALAASLASAGTAAADTEVPGLPVVASGEVSIGARTTWGDDKEAQFLQYRDMDEGVLGSFRILLEDKEGKYFVSGEGVNLGYKDQRYEMELGRYGRYKFDLFYKELPHVYSTDAVTLYSRQGGNEYLLPAGVQQRIEGAADPASQLDTELMSANPIHLRFRQIEGGGGVEVHPADGLTLYSRYRIQDREGNRALALDFGSPGGTFTTFAGPVDDQTHNISAGGDYTIGGVNFGLSYDGSFYENANRGATADNPLVATDAPGDPSRGRTSLDPDNSAHAVNLSASTLLPTPFPARVTGSFQFGARFQNEDFLEHTVNTAIASPTLPEKNLDGKVYTLLGNVVATMQPVDRLSVKLHWRYYDYDNRTDRITFDEHVLNDGNIVAEPLSTVPNDYTTNQGDVDLAYDVTDGMTGHLGYVVELWDRSSDRQVGNQYEHGPTAKLDWQIAEWVKTQLSYGFLIRQGDKYDTYAYFQRQLDPADYDDLLALGTGETNQLRKFDQAHRYVNKANALVFLSPCEDFDLTLSGGAQFTDYNNSHFGVQDDQSWFVGWDAYYQIHPRIGIGAYYSYESTLFKMDSRWRPRLTGPPFTVVNNPVNDWRSTTKGRTHTGGVNLDLVAIPDRLNVRLGYEINYSWEKTNVSSPPGSEGISFFQGGDTPYDWPTVKDRLQVVTAEGMLTVTENVELHAGYRFERFLIRDFRTDSLGPYRGGEDLWLGNSLGDYDAHILLAGAVVKF